MATCAAGNACVSRATQLLISGASHAGSAGLPVTVSVVCGTIVPALKATRMGISARAPAASVRCKTSLPVAWLASIVTLVAAGSTVTLTSLPSRIAVNGAVAPLTVTMRCCAGFRFTDVGETLSGPVGVVFGTGDALGAGDAFGAGEAVGGVPGIGEAGCAVTS